MARTKTESYIAYGGIEVKKGQSYNTDNFPAETTMVRLMRGVRIKDEYGKDTPLRGIRVKITTTGLTAATTPLANVPTIWYEGEIAIFDDNTTVDVYDNGLITYGEIVV